MNKGIAQAQLYIHTIDYSYIIYFQMKIVFKGTNFVKLYPGDLIYDQLVQFVKQVSQSAGPFTLSFKDDDDDVVMVSTQQDVDTMRDMYAEKGFVKIDVAEHNAKGESVEIKVEGKKEEKKEVPVAEEGERRRKNSRKGRKHHGRERSHSRSGSRGCRKWRQRKDIMECHIAKTVQEKLAGLIPCLVNQIKNMSLQSLPKVEDATGVVHTEVVCSGCATKPIKGIRYRCLQCHAFDLCQVCEPKIPHEHNLLKMRKAQEEGECLFGQGRKWRGRRCHKREQASSSSSQSAEKCEKTAEVSSSQAENKEERRHSRHHHKHRRHHHHKHEESSDGDHHRKHRHHRQHRHSSSHDDEHLEAKTPETHPVRFERLIIKMSKRFGGEPEQYKDFVSARMDQKFWHIVTDYCTENNIETRSWKGRRDPEEWKALRLRKLSLYFGKDESEFVQLVEENPELRFRDLLRILNDKGTYKVDFENKEAFKKLKIRLRREENQVESWMNVSKIVSKVSPFQKKQEACEKIEQSAERKVEEQKVEQQKPQEKTEALPEKKEQKPEIKETESTVYVRPDPKQIREKGRILNEMKDLFGEDKKTELFAFIQQNYKLGQEKMVEKWIELQFAKLSTGSK